MDVALDRPGWLPDRSLMAAWQSGDAPDCKSVNAGSIPAAA
jgi:hypothetical protein